MTIYTNAAQVWTDINSTNSIDEIINILESANESNITLDANDLKTLVLSKSTTIAGNNTVLLYSGTVGDQSSQGVAQAIANPDVALGGDFELNLDVLTQPFSRGYGELSAWQVAMSNNFQLRTTYLTTQL